MLLYGKKRRFKDFLAGVSALMLMRTAESMHRFGTIKVDPESEQIKHIAAVNSLLRRFGEIVLTTTEFRGVGSLYGLRTFPQEKLPYIDSLLNDPSRTHEDKLYFWAKLLSNELSYIFENTSFEKELHMKEAKQFEAVRDLLAKKDDELDLLWTTYTKRDKHDLFIQNK